VAYRRQQDHSRPQPLFSIRRIDEFWFDVPNEGAFVGEALKPSDIERQRTGQLLLYKEVVEAKGALDLFAYQLLAVDQGTDSVVGSTMIGHVGVLATSAGSRIFSCTPVERVKTDHGTRIETCLCHRPLNGTSIAPIFSSMIEMLQDRGGWRWANCLLPRVVRSTAGGDGLFPPR
jgi:hypothetical protein